MTLCWAQHNTEEAVVSGQPEYYDPMDIRLSPKTDNFQLSPSGGRLPACCPDLQSTSASVTLVKNSSRGQHGPSKSHASWQPLYIKHAHATNRPVPSKRPLRKVVAMLWPALKKTQTIQWKKSVQYIGWDTSLLILYFALSRSFYQVCCGPLC